MGAKWNGGGEHKKFIDYCHLNRLRLGAGLVSFCPKMFGKSNKI